MILAAKLKRPYSSKGEGLFCLFPSCWPFRAQYNLVLREFRYSCFCFNFLLKGASRFGFLFETGWAIADHAIWRTNIGLMGDTIDSKNPPSFWFRHGTVMDIFHQGGLVDGRRGGLVVGRSHEEGGIYILQQTEADRYEIQANIEGGEYVLSHKALLKFRERLEEINSWYENGSLVKTISVTSRTRVINSSATPHDRLILFDFRGQFVVNNLATTEFFEELEQMNDEAGDFSEYEFDISLAFGTG